MAQPVSYLLAIETSTKVASVALAGTATGVTTGIATGISILAEFTTDIRKTHSQRLLPMVDRVLAEAGLRPADLGAVACTTGPGSFTGLRLGLATVKGLAFALKIPAFGVPTLDALANNLGILEPEAPPLAAELVCPVLDARKGQVYAAVYVQMPEPGAPSTGAPAQNGIIRRGPWALSPEELVEKLLEFSPMDSSDIAGDIIGPHRRPGKELMLLGDGTSPPAGAWPLIEKAFGSRVRLAPPWLRYPRAASVAALAARQWSAAVSRVAAVSGATAASGAGSGATGAGLAGDLDELQPVYLRPSEAEVMLAKKRELVP